MSIEEDHVLAVALSLTTQEQDALLGRPTWTGPVQKTEGQAHLQDIGLFHRPTVGGQPRLLRTDLGQKVRRLIEKRGF